MEEIHAAVVIEILGKPKDNVTSAITKLVDKLGGEKGIEIISKNIHEPVPAQDSKSLFTTFAEIEVKIENIERYFGIIFAYLPSNIEIIKPEKAVLTNSLLNELGNNLTQALHRYDAITKKALMEREFLLDKLKEASPEVYKEVLTPSKSKPEEEKKSG